MNAKQAKLLFLHEVVMWNNDPQNTGTVVKIDLPEITIKWKNYPTVDHLLIHNYRRMKFVDKWQPTEDQITDAIMSQQAGDE